MRKCSTILAASVLLVPMGASASLIGDTVTSSFTGGQIISSPGSAVVGSGAEFQIGFDFNNDNTVDPDEVFIEVDVEDSSITMTSIMSFPFGTDTLTVGDLDWVDTLGEIVDTSLAVTGVNGLDASDVSFTSNSVSVVFANSNWMPGDFAAIDLVTTHAVVPEPTTLALLSLGLAGLGFARRRKA